MDIENKKYIRLYSNVCFKINKTNDNLFSKKMIQESLLQIQEKINKKSILSKLIAELEACLVGLSWRAFGFIHMRAN